MAEWNFCFESPHHTSGHPQFPTQVVAQQTHESLIENSGRTQYQRWGAGILPNKFKTRCIYKYKYIYSNTAIFFVFNLRYIPAQWGPDCMHWRCCGHSPKRNQQRPSPQSTSGRQHVPKLQTPPPQTLPISWQNVVVPDCLTSGNSNLKTALRFSPAAPLDICT